MSLGTNLVSGASSGPIAIQAAIGTALLGLTSDQVAIYSSDFEVATSASVRGTPPGVSEVTGSGATVDDNVATPTGTPGGSVSRMQITATANSNAQQTGNNRIVGTSNSHKWYFAWRFCFTTTPTANTRYGMGLTDATQTGSIMAGVFGQLSVVSYFCQYDGVRGGTGISLAFPIDANYHVVEMWLGADLRYHARIDGGAEIIGGAVVAPKTGMQLWSDFFDNGAGSSAGTAVRDWFVYVVQRP